MELAMEGYGNVADKLSGNNFDECKTVAKNGKTCLKWSKLKGNWNVFKYPGKGLGNHNCCRNPDNDNGGQWCWVAGGGYKYC